LAVAKGNSQAAMLHELSIVRRLENTKQQEQIWQLFSAELLRYLNSDSIVQYAMKPMANVSSALKGQPTIYNLTSIAEEGDGKLGEVMTVCRGMVASDLYHKYCESPVSEYWRDQANTSK
jgi:hypothetical protein